MHRINRITIALVTGFGLLLGGCSLPEGKFPSLAKRPYETDAPITEPPMEPEILSTSLPDSLRTQLDALLAKHTAAETAFRNALPAARKAAQSGAGAAIGSESWVIAQMEVSRIEQKRTESLTALAEADRLVSAARDKGADAGLIALMTPYQENIRRAVEAQTAIIVELSKFPG